MISIRRSLLWSLLPAVLGLLTLAGLAMLYEVHDEIGEVFDAQLQASAYSIPPDLGPSLAADTEDDPRSNLVVAVWSRGAPVPRFHSRVQVALPEPAADGLSTVTLGGEPWRIFVRSFGEQRVEVAQPMSVRDGAAAEIASRIALPLVLLVPLLVFTVLFFVKRGLRPLTDFAGELDARSPHALESLRLEPLPAELLPMAEAMNHLLARLHVALSAQEVFIADAAHELLTPLTALQVQVQMLERARTEERRRQATLDVRQSLERCINLARQLLTLARQSTEAGQMPFQTESLGKLVREAMSRALPQAHARHIDLGMARETPVEVSGDARALQTLLANLLDNAIKYSPDDGRVDISIELRDTEATVTISDNGPGIAVADRERVFDRFYRSPEAGREGSGLGLAIAREIAERHGARIELRSPGALGGLDARVTFSHARAGQEPAAPESVGVTRRDEVR